MSDVSGDVSKASRSGSSHSESSQECSNDDETETPYIAAPPEEIGEVRRRKKPKEIQTLVVFHKYIPLIFLSWVMWLKQKK